MANLKLEESIYFKNCIMKIEVQGYFYIPSSTIQVVGKIEDLIKEIPSTISIKLDKDNYPKTYEEVCKLEKNINPDCNEKILEIKKLIEKFR